MLRSVAHSVRLVKPCFRLFNALQCSAFRACQALRTCGLARYLFLAFPALAALAHAALHSVEFSAIDGPKTGSMLRGSAL